MFRQLIATLVFFGFSDCLNLCGDWTQYNSTKCFKVLKKVGTQEEALQNCTKIDPKSTLPSIHSEEEQEFIQNLVTNYKNISFDVWLGMKYDGNGYVWSDGTDSDYKNWAPDAVKDGTDPCVQMYILNRYLGKWIDESCKKTGLILCQRKQELDLNILRIAFEEQEKTVDTMFKIIDNQQKEIDSLRNKPSVDTIGLPLGFIYTQFPNQSKPSELWPNTKWFEITSNYSGLFFRAEGGGSEPFGETQQANQSWISDVIFYGGNYETWRAVSGYGFQNSLKQNQWINANPSQTYLALYDLKFYTTGGEVRPKNTAIKIWKRIQ